MAVGQVLGAQLGPDWWCAADHVFVRPAFLVMAALTITRLLWINLAERR